MRKISCIYFLILLGFASIAQDGLIAHYSFDACDLEDATGMNSAGISTIAFDCDCGVESNALFLDGSVVVNLPQNLTAYLSTDFAISFYFRLDQLGQNIDILSTKNETCQIDSSLAIRYISATNILEIEIGEDFNDEINLIADIDLTKCWHHLVFTKQNDVYYLFYNGVLADEIRASKILTIEKTNSLVFSGGACQGVVEVPFVGRIDEFKLFNKFINSEEVKSLFIRPNEILNQDTTIFLGDQVLIFTGGSCASAPDWTPIAGVDDPTSLEPVLMPLTTTTYKVTLNDKACISTDTIAINVIDIDSIDCEALLLPNAFTPNNDGINDFYGISNRFLIEDLEFFEIIDRWGETIYKTNDKHALWDGTYKNKPVNPGMFLYIVKYTCKDSKHVTKGNFTVLR